MVHRPNVYYHHQLKHLNQKLDQQKELLIKNLNNQKNYDDLTEESLSYLSILKSIARHKISLPPQQDLALKFVENLLQIFFKSLKNCNKLNNQDDDDDQEEINQQIRLASNNPLTMDDFDFDYNFNDDTSDDDGIDEFNLTNDNGNDKNNFETENQQQQEEKIELSINNNGDDGIENNNNDGINNENDEGAEIEDVNDDDDESTLINQKQEEQQQTVIELKSKNLMKNEEKSLLFDKNSSIDNFDLSVIQSTSSSSLSSILTTPASSTVTTATPFGQNLLSIISNNNKYNLTAVTSSTPLIGDRKLKNKRKPKSSMTTASTTITASSTTTSSSSTTIRSTLNDSHYNFRRRKGNTNYKQFFK